MENVVSIMENGKDNYLKTFVMSLIDFGMDVEIDILDSSRYVCGFYFYFSVIDG
jgi:hypothetical protein